MVDWQVMIDASLVVVPDGIAFFCVFLRAPPVGVCNDEIKFWSICPAPGTVLVWYVYVYYLVPVRPIIVDLHQIHANDESRTSQTDKRCLCVLVSFGMKPFYVLRYVYFQWNCYRLLSVVPFPHAEPIRAGTGCVCEPLLHRTENRGAIRVKLIWFWPFTWSRVKIDLIFGLVFEGKSIGLIFRLVLEGKSIGQEGNFPNLETPVATTG